MIHVYSVPSELTSPKFAWAFARGCGGEIVRDKTLRDGPVAAFVTPPIWPVLRQARAEGREFYYGDHGYFGRGRYYRITKNAFQHDGIGTATPDRFECFGRSVQRWRKDGRHVLVCPQSPEYFALLGINAERWLERVQWAIRASTDRPIRTRMKRDGKPIAHDLQNCWAVVAFSSAAALDALIAGVPVFVLADFAAAYRMGTPDLTRIESPVYPEDRESFLWALAENQWTLSEIEDGIAWKALNRES